MNNLDVEFYRNYIGINQPLRLDVGASNSHIIEHLTYIDVDDTQPVFTSHSQHKYDDVKPYIKSPADLTDEEWLFVFGGNSDDYFIHDRKHSKHFKDYETETLLNRVMKEDYSIERCDQQILNRLYSLHVSLDYEELIKNNKAIKEDL